MSLGGPTGAGGIPGGLPQQQAPLARLAQSGWIEGRIASLPPEGGARIATFLGIVVAPEASAGMMPGDRVRLRLNPQTGKVEAQPLHPGQSAAEGPAPTATPRPLSPLSPVMVAAEPVAPHLTSAALAGLSPILPGPASGLGAAMPPPGSALYGLIAALFPRDDIRQRAPAPARRAGPGRSPDTAAENPAEDTDDAPLLPVDPPAQISRDPLDVIEWQAPAAGTEEETLPEDAPIPPGSPALPPVQAGQIVRMSGALPGGGSVHLDARRLGDLITLVVSSDRVLPATFAQLIRRQAEALALAWGARLACTFRVAPEAGMA